MGLGHTFKFSIIQRVYSLIKAKFTLYITIVLLTTRDTSHTMAKSRPPNYGQLTAASLLYLEFLTKVMDNAKNGQNFLDSGNVGDLHWTIGRLHMAMIINRPRMRSCVMCPHTVSVCFVYQKWSVYVAFPAAQVAMVGRHGQKRTIINARRD